VLLWKLWKWWRARTRKRDEPVAPAESGARPTGNPLPKLFAASTKMMLRDRRTMILALLVPVLFAVIFGVQDFGAKQHAKLAIVSSSSPFSREVVGGLRHDDAFRVSTVATVAVGRKRLSDGKTEVVLVVPPKPAPLTAYYKPTGTNNDFALGSLQRFVDSLDLRLAGVTAPRVRLAERSVAAKDTNYYDFLLAGLIAMGVMNLSIIGTAVAVTRFREQQILKRILATPLRPVKFLLAQIGARLALSLVQAAVILAVGVVGFGAHVHGDPVWIFLFAALGNLVFINIGFAIAGRAKNVDAAQSLSQLITLPMLFLSGVFFTTGGALGQAVRVLPLTPLVNGMRKIMLDGDSITQCGTQLGLLAAWVAISFVLARRSFRFGESAPLRERARRLGLGFAADEV
jgi:ABC-2 type transport system permease protein